MYEWLKRLPLTVRLPLLIAAMIFIVSIGSTQIAIQSMARQFERHMENIGNVYLDGISTALQPFVSNGDASGATEVLKRALSFHGGVLDRSLVLLDADGVVMARADRNEKTPVKTLLPPVAVTTTGFYFDDADNSLWVWRPLPGTPQSTGTLVANLDIAPFIQRRQYLQWLLAGIDLVFSALCAILGVVIARRLQKPLSVLSENLRNAGASGPQPIPESIVGDVEDEGARLLRAYNAMAAGAREREQMLSRLVDQEREAGLGRLAATIAHEVRNPLTGMLTAIKTLRKFGDRREVRAEALDFLERGVSALREVVNATLKTHRVQGDARYLSVQDLHDVHLLVEAEARRRKVTVELDLDLPETVPVNAAEVRQVLLNLLLNASNVSSPGGRVLLRGRLEAEELVLEVLDNGPGLEPDLAVGLETGVLPAQSSGLGVAVVVHLVERLGGRVSTRVIPHSGTHIALRIPLQQMRMCDEKQAS